MLRARVVCLVMLLGICGGVAADSTGAPFPPVVLEHGGTQVRVWETLNRDDEFKTLHIKATRDGRSAAWRYGDSGLDPEPHAVPAEIREVRGVPFLFVHDYSGGASCCWSLLVFDLAQLKPLGELLSSSASIDLRRKEAACGLEAEYYLVRSPTRRRVRCFDGTAFRKVPR